MAKKEKKSRNWIAVLYPDSNMNHKLILYQLIFHSKEGYKYVFINHKGEEKEEDSEVGKDHTHILINFENPQYKSRIFTMLGIQEQDEHFFVPCISQKGYLRYMIHYGYSDKISYKIDDLQGSKELINKVKKAINEDDEEEMRVKKITDFIDNSGNITVREVYDFCCENGLYSDFRRAYVMFAQIIKEHNNTIFLREE